MPTECNPVAQQLSATLLLSSTVGQLSRGDWTTLCALLGVCMRPARCLQALKGAVEAAKAATGLLDLKCLPGKDEDSDPVPVLPPSGVFGECLASIMTIRRDGGLLGKRSLCIERSLEQGGYTLLHAFLDRRVCTTLT